MAVHGRSRMRYPVCSQTPHGGPTTAGTFLPAGNKGATRTTHPYSGMVRRFAREDPAMASSTVTPPRPDRPTRPNLAFRHLRGHRSPAEFAALVRRAAREIGECVSCDARYIGRVEAGEIRCPNYAYERVFLHMFPGRTLTDLGFAPRASVRGRGARAPEDEPCAHTTRPERTTSDERNTAETGGAHQPYDTQDPYDKYHDHEESDVLRRAFMTGGGATMAAATLGPLGLAHDASTARPVRRAGAGEAGCPRRSGPQDPAAGRPARGRRPLPARGRPATRCLRAAGRRDDPADDRRPAPLGRR